MNLLPLLDSPKSYDELLCSVGNTSVLDIALSIHKKKGSIRLNDRGQWEIPKPPCMEEEEPILSAIEAAREANALACREYRAKHLEQHRAQKREYYKRNRREILAKARAKRLGVP
jgi:predicted NUDIX family NTP pyrophosphohydrolase